MLSIICIEQLLDVFSVSLFFRYIWNAITKMMIARSIQIDWTIHEKNRRPCALKTKSKNFEPFSYFLPRCWLLCLSETDCIVVKIFSGQTKKWRCSWRFHSFFVWLCTIDTFKHIRTQHWNRPIYMQILVWTGLKVMKKRKLRQIKHI